MHPTYFNASLRIKLDDFIGNEIESEVIQKIEQTYEKTRYPFQTLFWFEDEKLMAKELKRFVDNTQNKLPFKTTIKSLQNIKIYNYAWFNLVSNDDKDKVNNILSTSLDCRFKYIYQNNNQKQMLKGLDLFDDLLTFTLKPKPKKQKRNDYEEDSHSW